MFENARRVVGNDAVESDGNSGDIPTGRQSGSSSDEGVFLLAEELGIPIVNLELLNLDLNLIRSFPIQKLFEYEMLPVDRDGAEVRIATADPMAVVALDELACYSGFRLEPVVASGEVIRRLLKETLGVGGGAVGEMSESDGFGDDSSRLSEANDVEDGEASFVVKLVNELLSEAVNQQASDIHMEPEGQTLSVRYRVDGILRLQPVPTEIHRFRLAIISRLKIMARLNIAEKRLPQDGRFKLTIQGRTIDVRVSVIPMLDGEGVVMRLLDQSRSSCSLDSVEFTPELRERWERMIRRPHGMVLVTGPTGSGKTTTLYSSLAHIRSPDTKIITVEDPVEYQLPGISQIQVHGQIGLDFAAGLRSVLRHDPDVVLIGEIRDGETARSAVQASLTGHLVLSTLHTNDAASAFTRLVDMGIEEYLVASTLQSVLAQRLVRRICQQCREAYEPVAGELPSDFPDQQIEQLWRGRGCRACHQTGFSGRIAVFELLETDTEIRQMCIARASSSVIQNYAVSRGLISLRQSGWQRVLSGQTTVEEVSRVCCVD